MVTAMGINVPGYLGANHIRCWCGYADPNTGMVLSEKVLMGHVPIDSTFNYSMDTDPYCLCSYVPVALLSNSWPHLVKLSILSTVIFKKEDTNYQTSTALEEILLAHALGLHHNVRYQSAFRAYLDSQSDYVNRYLNLDPQSYL
jgi:hypothetical protein